MLHAIASSRVHDSRRAVGGGKGLLARFDVASHVGTPRALPECTLPRLLHIGQSPTRRVRACQFSDRPKRQVVAILEQFEDSHYAHQPPATSPGGLFDVLHSGGLPLSSPSQGP